MSRRRGQEAARGVLLACARKAEGRPGIRLPPMAVLARQAGVSLRTIWAASRDLVREGAIVARRGDGLYAAGVVPDRPPGGANVGNDALRCRAWELTCAAIRSDIHWGRFHSGDALPSLKELCLSYAVSYHTVKRALEALVVEQAVVSHGGRYRVRAHIRTRPQHRIALLTRRYPEEAEGRVPPRHLEDLILFESECRRLGLQISPLRLHFRERELEVAEDRDGVLSASGKARGVLGVVAWPSVLGDRFEGMWRRLLQTGRPVAVNAGSTTPLGFLTCPPGARAMVFRSARDFGAGVAMGHHLLGRGHTRVACISSEGMPEWADERLKGMRMVFNGAGFPGAVQVFQGPPPEMDSTGVNRRLEMVKELGDMVVRLGDSVEDRMAQSALRLLRQHVHDAIDTAYSREAALPQCRRAYEWGEATAYVGCNDDLSLICQSYLRQRGVPVDTISVAGFDNTRWAMLSGLSTYDFGAAAAIYRSIEFVLRPWSVGGSGTGPPEQWAEGQLVDRGSVRQVR